MTYASGGLIQAADYNGFAGGSAGANVSGQINTVWATGQGNAGLGQTAVANVSALTTVTAAQWASLINATNAIRKHQSGGGYANLTVPTAGSNIAFISTLASTLTTAYTNRNSQAAGAFNLTSLNKALTITASAGASTTSGSTFVVTFGSVDQTRYFFNSGGFIQLVYVSSTNNNGTARSTSLITLAQTNFNAKNMLATTFGARAGSGGTLITDTTTLGYYGQSTIATARCRINSTSYYSGDWFEARYNTNGTAGSYGANGNIITISPFWNSATTGSTQPADALNVTITMQVGVFRPAATFITDTWGIPTIA